MTDLSHWPQLATAKVLATDLDGTLLRDDHTVSDRTRTAIHAAIARGIHVVFVTGRPARWMPPVADVTGHGGVAVCANGSTLIDMTSESITDVVPIEPTAIDEAIAVATEVMGPGSLVAAEQAVIGPIDDSCLLHEAGFLPPSAFSRIGTRIRQLDRSELSAQPSVVKVLVRGEGHVDDAAAVAARAGELLGDRVTISHSSRTHQLLEIAPAGVSKGSRLAELVAGWGCSARDVVAVGDMPNDLPMVRWAGHGFAVASAHPLLIEASDAMVPDPEHDGVAQLLEAMG